MNNVRKGTKDGHKLCPSVIHIGHNTPMTNYTPKRQDTIYNERQKTMSKKYGKVTFPFTRLP